MVKDIFTVEGMSCPMCEAHLNDCIRNAFGNVKVGSDRSKNICEVVSEYGIDPVKAAEEIEKTGYKVISHSSVEYEKRPLFKRLFKRK